MTPREDIGRQEHIERWLAGLRRRMRLAVTLRGLGVLVVTLGGLGLLSFAVDRGFRLSQTGRVAVLAVLGVTALWTLWRHLLRPAAARLPDPLLADIVERRVPRLRDTLRSAVDFGRHAGLFYIHDPGLLGEERRLSIVLEGAVIRRAAEEVDRIDRRSLLDRGRVLRAGGLALLVLAAGTGLAAWHPDGFRTWYRRNLLLANDEWPYRTRLVVEDFPDGERRVPRGDPLEIRVRARGEIPLQVSLRMEVGGEALRHDLPREGGEPVFAHHHAAVTEPFEFTVEGGDFRSAPHRVVPLERPIVEDVAVVLSPPEYTGRDPVRSEGELGEIAAPRGSRLEIEGRSNKPLARAWLSTEGREVPLETDGERFAGSYVPGEGGLVTVGLEDRERVPPDRQFQFRVHLVPDRTPRVQLRIDGLGPMITANARMPLLISADDDYSVEALRFGWSVASEEAEPVTGEAALPGPEPPGPEVDEAPVWEVADIGVEPERRLDVRAGATDNDALAGAKTGWSETLSFLVVTPERLGEEFLRREEEQRRVLERLLEEEKGIRDDVYTFMTEAWKAEGGLGEATVQRMLEIARLERQHGKQCEAVADAIEQVLTEMRNNRVGEADDTERLAAGIVQPLRGLAADSMPAASLALGEVRDAAGADERLRRGLDLAERVETHVDTLESVIAEMARLEGFTEIVKHLRGIIETHEEAVQAAEARLESEVESIFEPAAGPDTDEEDGTEGPR